MNNQEFKQSVSGAIDKLEKQGKVSVRFTENGNDGCFYYDEKNNTCCIVGMMMPNNDVRKEADDNEFGSGIIYMYKYGSIEWAQQFTLQQVNFLAKLQRLHDAFELGDSFSDLISSMRKELETYDQ
ncbi:hypothetical protein [Haliea sp.]|uniref:hypothetical protein n=1 Tax=Haliea sp. TaxID=1932666 RepID=UPI0025BC1317|nr:hypothetical protein [Haliea sp.]|tara:strand:+ start:4726 stop:5103 length:378 start_codon:yes stop_codon:yes gene_type:complete